MGPPAVRPSLTTVVIAALAVGVVVLCVWQAATLAAPPQSNVRFHDGGIHVFAVAAGDLLDVAGVRPGDVIVAVDGAAVGSGLEFLDRLRAARPGAALRLSLQRAGHRLELTAIAQPGPDLRRLAPALLPVLGLLVAGVGVALTRPPSKATVLFLLLCASAALNTACQLTVVAGTAWPQRVITAAYALVSLQSPALLLHLFVVFPERLRSQRWLSAWLPVAYGIQTCLGLSYYLPSWLPASTEALRDPQLHRFLFSAFGANAVICPALAAVSLAWQARQGTSDRIRQQARLLFFGLALMTVLQLALQEIPVRLSGRTLASPSVLALLDLLLPLVVVVAILRHRLFGIDLLVRRGLILGTASAAAAAALAATFGVLWWAAQRLGERPGTVVAVAAMAAGAVAFPVLRRRSQDWVDRALYHRRYSYRRLLDEISEQLARPFDAAGVAFLLEARLADALEPEQVDLVLWRDPPGELQRVAGDGCVAALAGGAAARDLAGELARARAPFTTGPGAAGWPPSAALMVPLCRGEVVVGALVLGPRRQELPYVAEDLEFLAALARLTAPVLENARLLEERAAKERLVLLGTATAAVVHELKNPLAAIRSTTAILRRRLREDDRGRELAGVVEEEVERLEGTLLEVLGYARPAASTPAPVLVGDVVRQLATVVEPDLRRSGVELVMTVHDGVGVVRSDPERLRRALLNLLLNARDAMPQGGTVEVVVAPWRQDGGPPRGAEITVSDSGSGFSPEALTRAFEPFYSSKRLGTGLGLANVRRTVEESGGEVMLANRPSGGATVVLRLPAAIPGGEG